METSFDAIIIGAGPAGSSAAILLARAGWSVALVQKQIFPRRKVCGECIAASNLPLLEALGIGLAFERAAGSELRHVALMRGERTVVAELPPASHPNYPWGRALGRETLDTLLLEEALAAGAQVFQPWTVKALQGGAGAWCCKLRGADAGESLTLRAPVAIAAHGSWESLPSERPPRRGRRSGADLLAFKANFRGAALQEGLLPVLCFDGGYGGMVVADGGDFLSFARVGLPATTYLDPGPLGCIGVGTPFGVAAALACPGRLVLVATGKLLSVFDKRASQGEAGKWVVADGADTHAFNPAQPTTAETEFMASLALQQLPPSALADLRALYQAVADRITALAVAQVTGHFKAPEAATAAPAARTAAQRQALAERSRLLDQLASARSTAAKARQMSQRVELNLQIQRLLRQLQEIQEGLAT